MIKVRIVHETNPRKYFPAIYELQDSGICTITGEHRYSVLKEWVRAAIKDRTGIKVRTKNAIGDVRFRISMPWIKNETIILGFAPWDWRILLFRNLAKRNRIIYHTSWHDWREDFVPRRPRLSILKSLLRAEWRKFLQMSSVEVVAVTSNVAASLDAEFGVKSRVIPHAVPEVFYLAGKKRKECTSGLKVLFVGEVSEKKGIKEALSIVKELSPLGASITVVGTGPLGSQVEQLDDDWLTFLGPISDRKELAEIMSQHDVLLALSQKTETWEELFCIVIVEALAAGIAVVASDHAGPKAILEEAGLVGLFSEKNSRAVTELMRLMLEDRQHVRSLYRAQSIVRDRYMISEVSQAWSQVIASGR